MLSDWKDVVGWIWIIGINWRAILFKKEKVLFCITVGSRKTNSWKTLEINLVARVRITKKILNFFIDKTM